MPLSLRHVAVGDRDGGNAHRGQVDVILAHGCPLAEAVFVRPVRVSRAGQRRESDIHRTMALSASAFFCGSKERLGRWGVKGLRSRISRRLWACLFLPLPSPASHGPKPSSSITLPSSTRRVASCRPTTLEALATHPHHVSHHHPGIPLHPLAHRRQAEVRPAAYQPPRPTLSRPRVPLQPAPARGTQHHLRVLRAAAPAQVAAAPRRKGRPQESLIIIVVVLFLIAEFPL